MFAFDVSIPVAARAHLYSVDSGRRKKEGRNVNETFFVAPSDDPSEKMFMPVASQQQQQQDFNARGAGGCSSAAR